MKKILAVLMVSWMGLLTMAQQKATLSSGQWLGELIREDGVSIVFNFEVSRNSDSIKIYLLNGTDRLEADDISIKGDSVSIRLPFFDSRFNAILLHGNTLQGTWVKRLADREQTMRFVAVHQGAKRYRFEIHRKQPVADISGRWATGFVDESTGNVIKAVGVLDQKGTYLTGSFLTRSGGYRYLEGVVDGDSLKLSGFDGGYAVYFTAKVNNDRQISGGKYFSETSSVPRIWQAVKDPKASIPDDPSLSVLRPGISRKLNFTFRDVNGHLVSFTDEPFQNKIMVIQILGSWCPNCMDETLFLNEVYQKYKSKGVGILGLAYERTADFARSQKAVNNFVKRLKVEYPVLITPVALNDPDLALKTLPQLEKIAAFPTTIFTNRNGEIQKIHPGFSNPGSGEDYEKQKQQFFEIIEGLLSEQ